MIGWRAQRGFLVPPGNPMVELEMMPWVPPGVSLHSSCLGGYGFHRHPDGPGRTHPQ